MSTRADEERILHEMERDLRRGDRLLPVRFTFVRARAALHRTTTRRLLAVEAALLALALLGALLGVPQLLIPAAGAALTVLLIAMSRNPRSPDTHQRAPSDRWRP